MDLGVCYYPEQWSAGLWADDARRMAELGLRVVRIAEFAWARLEPREGEYAWGWLDEAVSQLARAGLKVVLGTPTAAPPQWLVNQHPDILPIDAMGRTKAAGSRRHVCLSNPAYIAASRRIVSAMAERYGRHPAVVAWQTDNEYGCHDTAASYTPAALERFREWLAECYGDIATLNERWGNVFWSMSYGSFEDIGFPAGQPAQANPAHALDHKRFVSDEVLRFNRMQVQILREHAPGRDVLHNFMGFYGEFDIHAMGRDLDLATWDSYPLGHTDSTAFIAPDDKLQWARSGHPDLAAFHHDLYRGVGRGRFGVMEQQAGPVNWAPWNPAPQPGQVRAWTWEAFAHGAELVSYFRWRQLPYAQEQMHSGLNTPDNRLDAGGEEAAQVARELSSVAAALGGAPASSAAPVALLLDYPSHWMVEVQRHGADFSYFGEAFAWYSAARRLGLDIDILPPEADLAGRRLVLVPALLGADDGLAARLAASGAQVLIGPRSGSKTADFRIPDALPPGPLAQLAGVRVRSVESLRPGLTVAVDVGGQASRWREWAEPAEGTLTEARFADGRAAVLRRATVRYLAGCFDAELLRAVMTDAARDAGLPTELLAPGLRTRRRGPLRFAFHAGPDTVATPAPANARFVLGGDQLGPAGVAAWFEA